MQGRHIAVLGGGLAGLAIAWHLIDQAELMPVKVTLYEGGRIGSGTSAIAAGLLHAYAGRWSTPNWRGAEGLAAALQLITIAEKSSNLEIIQSKGLLRLPIDDLQWEAFCRHRAHDRSILHDTPYGRALFISTAYAIDCRSYLEGLKNACIQRGVTLVEHHPVERLEALDCDVVIAATGAAPLHETAHLPIRRVKGHLMTCRWKDSLHDPHHALMESCYLVPHHKAALCTIGASFEKQFDSESPDPAKARELLWPSALKLHPQLTTEDILEYKAGIRASTPDHRPIYKRLSTRHWVATGLGSKGLLYHALMGGELATEVLKSLYPS